MDAVPNERSGQVLQQILEETASPVGEAFFRSLVSSMASTLHVRYAFIGELVGSQSNRLRTHALWAQGKLSENIEYNLVGTPCENVLGHNGVWSIPQGMRELFPPLGVESYLGLRVRGVSGKVIGIIGIMDDDPMTNSDVAGWTMLNMTARVGAELERQRVGTALEAMASFAELNPAPVLRVDSQGTILLANQATIQRFNGQEVVGTSWFTLCPEADTHTFTDWLRDGRTTLQHEAQLGKDAFLFTYRHNDNHEVQIYGMDITARKRSDAFISRQKGVVESIALGAPLPEILMQLCQVIEEHAPGLLCSILILDGDRLRCGAAPSLPEAYTNTIDGLIIGPDVGSCGTAAYRNEAVIVSDISTDPLWDRYRDLALSHGLHACWSVPITSTTETVLGTFALYYREPRSYAPEDFRLIESSAHVAGIAIQRTRTEEEIERLRDQLTAENTYLREEISAAYPTDHIIGNSPAIRRILDQITPVARTDSTVFIQGETGTGKELIARAIHAQSHRNTRPLVTVNCASIPGNLIESELFGHTRGAFTGATENRIGRFELAEGGTIFLDEVSALPLEMQAKLVRVLQEREFERVGESHAVKLDTRFIAASNIPLEQAVQSGVFRKDLFYRLNVFPIEVPALRDRQEDLTELAMHFVERLNKKMGKAISTIEEHTLARFMSYSWPGNIRELENIIERAMILARGFTLRADIPLPDGQEFVALPNGGTSIQWESHERAYLQKIMEQAGGVIYGPKGAAKRLGINPSTLRSRLKRLGIQKTRREGLSTVPSESNHS